jgi:acetyl-CoA carboxylase biotin carboxyl carrier protein
VQTIRDLVALMSQHDLSEINLREGEMRIRLRRGPRRTVQMTPTAPAVVPASSPPAPLTVPAEPAKNARQLLFIKSQALGTFYAAPSPDAKPYVEVGSRVGPKTVVGTVEAMKVFNEITADCSGVIIEVCVQNQQHVEYEQVLFKVDPAG